VGEDNEQATAECPPHRWFIESEYKPERSTETWTCSYCQVSRVVVRERGETLAKVPWAIGRGVKPNQAAAPTQS